jgi:hypothetical protein
VLRELPREEPERPQAFYPVAPEEDLWSMAPDDAGIQEIIRREFHSLGGVDSPGTDPEAARLEVSTPGWAERQEAELRAGLSREVLFGGAQLDGLDCERGRCLVELRYDSMLTGVARIEPIRRWLSEEVRCRAYTEGPDEGESPSVLPSQQIWVLCGEPEQS